MAKVEEGKVGKFVGGVAGGALGYATGAALGSPTISGLGALAGVMAGKDLGDELGNKAAEKAKKVINKVRNVKEGKSLVDIIGELYEPNPNPEMKPETPDEQAKFFRANNVDDKGNPVRPKRITDIDPSTLDDKLFCGDNIKTAKYNRAPGQKDTIVGEEVNDNSGEDDLGRNVNKVSAENGGNSKDDMEAFDQFGPKTRAALNYNMPVKWSSAETLRMMGHHGMDPRDPHVDTMMANHLTNAGKTISSQLRMESFIVEAAATIKKQRGKHEIFQPLARKPMCEVLGSLTEAKDKKKAAKKAPEDEDADIEAKHEKTLAEHTKAMKRARAEDQTFGLKQDFGPDKSTITSQTSKGMLTTCHEHGNGRITHDWGEAK